MRKLPLIFGCMLVPFALARIFFEIKLRYNPRLERMLCRSLLLCSEDLLLEKAEQQLTRGGPEGLKEGLESFQEALRRNQASPDRWCDLGEGLLASAQTEKAKHCVSRAQALGGRSVHILWRAAEFYFRIKDNKAALRRMSRILSEGTAYDSEVFDDYIHSGAPLLDTLDYGIPESPRPARSYFRYLLGLGNASHAQEAWNWVVQRSLADDRLAVEYVDFLIKRREYETAIQTWTQYLGQRKGSYRESNFLYNGDFELEPGGCVFDWKVTYLDGVEAGRDPAVSCSGSASLRIQFEGKENLNYSHISQMAVVKPGGYLFRAQVRTEGITTDQGVEFRITDAESPARLDIKTENLAGTAGWRKMEARFLVRRQTRMIQVQVVRRPSWKFDNKISGTAWIDAVSLVPLSPP